VTQTPAQGIVRPLAEKAKAAARLLAVATRARKDGVPETLAKALTSARNDLLEANQQDEDGWKARRADREEVRGHG